MDRITRISFVALVLAASGGHAVAHAAPTATPAPESSANPAPLHVTADRDDDDLDGTVDGEQSKLPVAITGDFALLPRTVIEAVWDSIDGDGRVRILVRGVPVPMGARVPPGAVVQGVRAGNVTLTFTRGKAKEKVPIVVDGAFLRDGLGRDVDPVSSHVSIERTPPARFEGDGDARFDDPDALRVVLVEPAMDPQSDEPPPVELSVESLTASGVKLDRIGKIPVVPAQCPRDVPAAGCFASAPIRFVVDDVDRGHPLVAGRSLRAEVGGAIVVRREGRKALLARVLGPRASSVGPIGRLRATIRPFVVRMSPKGAPAIGTTEAGAVAILRAELALASATWGQCGVTFGDARNLDVRIVDPPTSHLLALGDDVGLPASGGEIRVKVDGRPVTVKIPAGATPSGAAFVVARTIEKAGFVAHVSPNARIGTGAMSSVDVLVRRPNGVLATILPPAAGTSLSTDATLSVRIGYVALEDGLDHFRDVDAVAGTLEERTLLKAVDDGDPRTIELVVVPSFAGGVRIGESFIGSDASSLRNVVILDRAGIRARKSSLTLAHELGHVLLDMPDHPDDYGLDTPTMLMDSDASDASPFGPRRLTTEECARVVRQSGPKARLPLLADWSLRPGG
ncbi:MAG: hypothetical protein U0169_24585 [Polyangiaceae bacterium]